MIYIGENEVMNVYVGSDETNVYIGDIPYSDGGSPTPTPSMIVGEWDKNHYRGTSEHGLQSYSTSSGDGYKAFTTQIGEAKNSDYYGTSDGTCPRISVSNVLSGNNGQVELKITISRTQSITCRVYVYVDTTYIGIVSANATDSSMILNINDDNEHYIYCNHCIVNQPSKLVYTTATVKIMTQ